MNPRVLDQKLLHTFQSILETLLTFWFGTKGYISLELVTREKPPTTIKSRNQRQIEWKPTKNGIIIKNKKGKKVKFESMNLPLMYKENMTTITNALKIAK